MITTIMMVIIRVIMLILHSTYNGVVVVIHGSESPILWDPEEDEVSSSSDPAPGPRARQQHGRGGPLSTGEPEHHLRRGACFRAGADIPSSLMYICIIYEYAYVYV